MVPNPRKPEVVKRHLESVQKALKEREKRYARFFVFIVMTALTFYLVDMELLSRRWLKRLIRPRNSLTRPKKSLSRCLR
jgi:hypothetical protein